MAVAFGPTSCPSGFVLKSELLHNPEVQYGFVPQTSHHGGKNIALRAKKQIILTKTNTKTKTFSGFKEFKSARVQELFFSEARFFPQWRLSDGTSPWMFRLLCESWLSGTDRRNKHEGPTASDDIAGFLRFL